MREFLSGRRCRVESSVRCCLAFLLASQPPPPRQEFVVPGGGGIDHNSHVVASPGCVSRSAKWNILSSLPTRPIRPETAAASSSSSSFHVLFTARGGLATLRSDRVTPTSSCCCCLPFPLIADILFSRSVSSRFYTRWQTRHPCIASSCAPGKLGVCPGVAPSVSVFLILSRVYLLIALLFSLSHNTEPPPAKRESGDTQKTFKKRGCSRISMLFK